MRTTIRNLTLAAALAATALAPRAAISAEPSAAGNFSVIGAETIHGAAVMDVQAGWPSTTFGYTVPLSQTSDVSFRFGLLYGFEGTTADQFGLSLYAPLRFQLASSQKMHLLLHVDPGLKLYTTSDALFGFQFPVGLVLGFPVEKGLEVGVGLDFNMSLFVTGYASPRFVFGPAIGPYVQYQVTPQIVLGLNTRFGAAIDSYSSEPFLPAGTNTEFAFMTQLVFGYRP
jgi:hypothetical protein